MGPQQSPLGIKMVPCKTSSRTLHKVRTTTKPSKSKDTVPKRRKPKPKLGLLAKVVACQAKLDRLQTKLEENYVGVSADTSPAVRKLDALIQKTRRQLGVLKMRQYAARATRRATVTSTLPALERSYSEPLLSTAPPGPEEKPDLLRASTDLNSSADKLQTPRKSRRSSQSLEAETFPPDPSTDKIPDLQRVDTDKSFVSNLTRCDSVLSNGVVRTLTAKAKRKISSLDEKIETCNAKLHRPNQARGGLCRS